MKKELLTIFLFCLAIFVSGQKVIENPKYGISSPAYLKLKKIEITDDATILSFHLQVPQNNWITVHEKSYIQPVGDTTKYYLIKADGINIAEQIYWEKDLREEISYRLFFPKLDNQINQIDFNEPIANSFRVYDIEIGDQTYRSIIPKDFTGNWFSEDNGNWTYSFFEKTAIFDNKTWEYVSVVKDNDFYRIKLKSGKAEKIIYGKPVNKTNCMLGDAPASTKKFSREMVRSNNLISNKFKEPLFKPGTVIYKGFLKGFTKRLGTNTGMIRFSNRLTNKQESYLIKLDESGYFEVEFPLNFPQELTVSLPLFNERVFFEPGKTLFHLLNTGDAKNPSLFMGESAEVNTGLLATSKIKTGQTQLIEGIEKMTEYEYLNYIKTVAENERKALTQIQKERNFDEKTMQIRNLDINFRLAQNAF